MPDKKMFRLSKVLSECLEEHFVFIKRLDNSRIPISKCYNCLEKCNPAKVPYCITKALINAVKGDVDNGLIFCGDNVGRINKITTVHSLMKELTE